MSRPVQIVPDVWYFPSAEGSRNCGVIHHDRSVVLVDPGLRESELNDLQGFLSKTGRQVVAVVETNPGAASPGVRRWPAAPFITAESEAPLLPIPDWDLLHTLGAGRLGLYNRYERILFCADLLSDPAAQTPVPLLAGGTESYLVGLEALEKLDFKYAVPSSGAPARGKRESRKRLERDRAYIGSVARQVQQTMASGVPLEHALRAARTAYSEYPFLEAHLSNVRAIWDELSALQG